MGDIHQSATETIEANGLKNIWMLGRISVFEDFLIRNPWQLPVSISGDLPALSAYQGAQADPKLAVGEGILGFFSVDSIWKQRLA